MTLTDEKGIEWTILGVPSDFCGEMYAELEAADGSRTVRLAGQLRAAGYDVPEREVEARPIQEGRCIEWSGEKREQPERVVSDETTPEGSGMIEVEPGVFAFTDHE